MITLRTQTPVQQIATIKLEFYCLFDNGKPKECANSGSCQMGFDFNHKITLFRQERWNIKTKWTRGSCNFNDARGTRNRITVTPLTPSITVCSPAKKRSSVLFLRCPLDERFIGPIRLLGLVQNARHLAWMIMIIARLHMITAVVNARSKKG